MNYRRWLDKKEVWFIVLVLLAILAFPRVAFAQSCALCYTQAASTGQKVIQALRSGILILVLPPTLGSVGMVFVLRNNGRKTRRRDDAGEPCSDWQNDESRSLPKLDDWN